MECVYISSIGLAEFTKRFHNRAAAERLPMTGSIEITPRCNLGCPHCYINLPASDVQARAQELTAEEWRRVLDEITDAGCLTLLMTGGEPFVRPDFLEIYIYAKQKGLLITLFTNGTTITPRIADYLAEWPPYSVEITLYGPAQATYEQVTGVPGSYQRCVRGINLLLDRKIPLALKSTITTANQHTLPEMKAFAETLGAPFRFDAVLNMRFDGAAGPGAARISPHDVVVLDQQDAKRAGKWREMFRTTRGATSRPEYLYQCGAGINTFHIDAYGQLSICMMVRHSGYDLRAGTFHEGWGALDRDRLQLRTKAAACQTCDLLRLCSQCPGFAYLETGDPEQRVDYLCQITHLREETFSSNADCE